MEGPREGKRGRKRYSAEDWSVAGSCVNASLFSGGGVAAFDVIDAAARARTAVADSYDGKRRPA